MIHTFNSKFSCAVRAIVHTGPMFAQQTAAHVESIVAPANSYALAPQNRMKDSQADGRLCPPCEWLVLRRAQRVLRFARVERGSSALFQKLAICLAAVDITVRA